MAQHILVVDDNEDIRNSVKLLLEHEKFTIICAENGDRCIEKLKKNKNIDLVLLDLKMPGISMTELFKEFKKMNLKMPLILFSASHPEETKETLERGMAQGVEIADYIEKPFNNKELIARIRKVLATA